MKKRYLLLLLVFLCFIIAAVWWLQRPATVAPASTPALSQYPLLSQPQVITQTLNDMVFVKGGSYIMGTDDKRYMDATEDDAHPHKVILTGFYIPKYLTAAQQLNSYYQLTGQAKKIPRPVFFDEQGRYPAENTWHTVHSYCQWLGQVTGLPFSLPTEAQWEYAASNGGKNVAFATDNGRLELGKNYPLRKELDVERNGKRDYAGAILVNGLPVNQLGLHQMGGNLAEWMQDWYAPDYYWHSALHDPQGPAHADKTETQLDEGKPKVLRGFDLVSEGADGSQFQDMTVYTRSYDNATGPLAKDADIYGFRCVINSDKALSVLKAQAKAHQAPSLQTS